MLDCDVYILWHFFKSAFVDNLNRGIESTVHVAAKVIQEGHAYVYCAAIFYGNVQSLDWPKKTRNAGWHHLLYTIAAVQLNSVTL